MATVNGDQAIAWMRARGTNVPGSCLNTCWQAYGSHPSIGDHAGQYPEAIDGWNYATKRHADDTNPPAGYPVWFGPSPTRTDSDAGAGDVVISLGGGQVIATDANGIGGRIGITTIAARAARIQRPYLGWTEDFLGYDVVTSAAAAGLGSTPLEDDMFTDQDRNTLQQLANAVFAGGPSMPDHGLSLGASIAHLDAALAAVSAVVTQPVQRTINGKAVQIAQIQDNADSNTMLRQIVAEWGALQSAIATIKSGGVDSVSIEAAAKAGAGEALASLKLEAVPAAPAS